MQVEIDQVRSEVAQLRASVSGLTRDAELAARAAASAGQLSLQAQNAANQALAAGQASQSCCDASNEKIDRVFKKSMSNGGSHGEDEEPPAPAPTPPLPTPAPGGDIPDPHGDGSAAVDQFLARLELGNIAFNAPDSLNLYDTAEIELLLSLVSPVEQLKQMLKAEGERIGAQIRVSDRMEARLTGSTFSITAVTPETQAVSESDRTRWQWEVKPNDVGPQKLHLTLSALLTIEGNSTPRAIRTFDKVIDVHVRWHQRATSFLKENWQWLWAVVLAPVAAWVWNKLRRRTAQP